MLVDLIKKYQYQLLLSLLVLAILYPLSLFIYVPKWDNINGYLPYRYFISDYLWNGHLPLWNPFQNLGYPGYSDLQSGVWNPIVWIILLFGKYTINSLIVELLSCYLLAGLGMFKLSHFFFKCEKTSFILGLSYALSGFMVGSSQLMVFLLAVTWFPWCIYALLKFFKTYRLKYQLLSAIFIAFFITSASPAYTIILIYIVVGIFLYQIILQKANKIKLKKILIGGSIILTALIILILPYINSFIEFAPYFNRSEKLEYDAFLLENPFTPISYISFLLPHSVLAKTDWFNITDLSLRNGYFGLIGLIAFASSFLSKFNGTKIVLTIGVFVSLFLAAGDQFFLFKYLYALPGFGVFRHPSIFRAFTIFCGLLLGGNELKIAINNGVNKRHKIAFLGIVSLVLIAGLWAFTKTSFSEVKDLILNIYSFIEISESALSTHILLNSTIVILLLGFTFILKRMINLSWLLSLFLFTILDLGIQTRLTIPTTICYNFSQKDLSTFFQNLPNDINQNDNFTPLKTLDETQALISTPGIRQNVSTFNKTLSSVGVNPMRFKSFDRCKESGVFEKNIENPILFFPKKSAAQISSIKIGYNKFTARIKNNSTTSQKLHLNQNYHAQWHSYYNGNPLIVDPANEMIMAAKIPANSEGEIEFVFDSKKTPYFVTISILSYLIIIIFLLKRRKNKANQ